MFLIDLLKTKKRKFQAIIIAGVILVSSVFLAYPFLPTVEYYVMPPKDNLVKEKDLQKDIVKGRVLIISKIGVKIPIIEGENESEALNKGAWRLPQTSIPEIGGNMALAAHRFKYMPPHQETFYLLDKLSEGDIFQVFWEGREYRYEVVSTEIVKPTNTEVISNTNEPTVTLITCHPLFSDKNRLIVKGRLIEIL